MVIPRALAARLRPPSSPLPRLRICPGCRRALSSSPSLSAGHNKWSKVKHIKVVADKAKSRLRTEHSKLITLYSRLYGADVNFNPQLASAIAAAKKASLPKENIDRAIARGQGRSLDGSTLESMTLEANFPLPEHGLTIALVLDVETDNRKRSTQELRADIKRRGGLAAPTAFLFQRLGRVVLTSTADNPEGIAADDVLDAALEAGAEDLDERDDGSLEVWTAPSATAAVVDALAGSESGKLAHGNLQVVRSELAWRPVAESRVTLSDDAAAAELADLLEVLRAYPEVQGLYVNVARGPGLSDEAWARIEESADL